MYPFNYHRPATLKDAAALLSTKDDAKLLAGGQTLIASMKLRLAAPSDLVDLSAVKELRGITVGANEITIGAMTTHAEVAESKDIQRAIPALALLAGGIGDRMVRHRGTIGGSIANNDPAADYPAAVLGLGATVHTDRRKIPADQFFKGLYETALDRGEIVSAISFPIPKRAGYVKFNNPASRYALVGVFVAETANGIRAAVTGAASVAYRFTALESALSQKFAAESVTSLKVDASGFNSDMHASAEYRAHLVKIISGRAIAQALAR